MNTNCIQYLCNSEDGDDIGKVKNKKYCNTLSPFTAGFNEAACDTFSGTWCSTPRDCLKLRNYTTTLNEDANIRSDKQYFYCYINDAPNIKDLEHVQEFSNVREYFDYAGDDIG